MNFDAFFIRGVAAVAVLQLLQFSKSLAQNLVILLYLYIYKYIYKYRVVFGLSGNLFCNCNTATTATKSFGHFKDEATAFLVFGIEDQVAAKADCMVFGQRKTEAKSF